ncbi:cadherin-like beta sandwich domain-containing protein [Paenibacillus agaridevorans]|uniref:cadherin-like beta sandwich domain-containing protein n=1 Tax=Paenibacillus agaridevorans TaxID=171404 RepID=UPI001BE40F82|nr:cadherin-like beta sandwich domain-containing protein [Paenibacillus agaridevorans]
MQKRSLLSTLAAVTLLLPLIGSLATAIMVIPVSAAAVVTGKVMTGFQNVYNNVYDGYITEYTFSSGGVVQQSASPPSDADWITPSNINDTGWGNSSNEVYTYSNFGEIDDTTDPMSIPPTAAWVTISSFQLSWVPIESPVYHYSVNGTDVLTATNALDIPSNALWATIVSFNDGWNQITNETYTTYTLARAIPSVISLELTSFNGQDGYVKNGNAVILTLHTDIPIARPVLEMAGNNMPVAGSGTSWNAVLTITTSQVPDGNLSVSAAFYSLEGVPGQVQDSTTDGSSFIVDQTAPVLSYSLSPAGATNEDVTVQVTANEAGIGVGLMKWAPGVQSGNYLLTQGTTFTGSFTAAANGSYTVFAQDLLGNPTMFFITVSNIDRTNPTVSLAASTTAPTNADIEVTATVADDVAINKQLWAAGLQSASFFQSGNGTSFTDQFDATANGTYSVYVEDTAGNYAITTITVSNLFKTGPELTLTAYPETPTNDTVMVEIEAQADGEDEGNALVALLWAEGNQEIAYFTDGGGQDVLADQAFEASDNGPYTVYARDTVGNEKITVIDITNIDLTAPTLTLTPDVTAPTNHHVTITVTAEDSDSGLRYVRWSATEPNFDSPWPSSEVEDDEFTVESNGTYTVIAYDNAGNKTLRQISVTNIMNDVPTVLLRPGTTAPVGNKVSVAVEAAAVGAGNAIDVMLWAPGDLPTGFFREGISDDITEEMQFEVTTNGIYTVYVRDIAGNEALEKIQVDNIRSTNAALAELIALNVEEELLISPTFDSEQLHYALQVGSDVQSIMLTAEAADESASVTVDGNPIAAGDSASVTLLPGANTIRIVVTAQLASVTRTYTIEATREKRVSSGSVQKSVFVAELNGKLTTGLNETITRGPDGMIMYGLKLDDATAIAALAGTNGENELRIEPNGEAAPQIDAVTLTLSAKVQSQLKEKGIRLTLDSGDAIYELPAGFAANGGGELIVQLKSLRQSKDANQLLNGATAALTKEWQLKPVGVPVAWTTNAASTADSGRLVMPLPEGLDATALRKLAVYSEIDDDYKTISAGTVRYDSQGHASDIVVDANASGRVMVLQAEPLAVKYDRYINGYPDGSFAPSHTIMRAELAALLMKLSTLEADTKSGEAAAADYGDVPHTHWAAEAIDYVTAAGWMGGGSNGLFRPGDPLTRAELAAVLVRWREVQAIGHTDFADADSHWASTAIASAEREGWLVGYTDGSFRPDAGVTRAEAVTVLNRVLGRPSLTEDRLDWSDVPSSHWAADAIRSASQSFEALHYLSGEIRLIVK